MSTTNPPPQQTNELHIKIYQLLEPYGRLWLDTYHLHLFTLETGGLWIEFNVIQAVKNWLDGQRNLGFEIYCESCYKHGLTIIHDSHSESNQDNSPMLNIMTKNVHREKRSKKKHQHLLHQMTRRKQRQTDCQANNDRCCRHNMPVVFKEIKGFEFILQPKVFDAGVCRGRCPARYNPAHHHALIQSIISKQDKNKAPRPCCAPSKLNQLEVLHVDEEDSTKLKVSTWSDMRVLECACS